VDPILAGPIAAGLIDGYTAYYHASIADMLDLCEMLIVRHENERRGWAAQERQARQRRGRRA